LKCKVKNQPSQDETKKDFTAVEVCRLLGVSKSWLARHRDLFVWWTFPGRGRNGLSLRFTRDSVESYRRRRIQESKELQNPYAGKTVEEIAVIAKERVRRGLVSASS